MRGHPKHSSVLFLLFLLFLVSCHSTGVETGPEPSSDNTLRGLVFAECQVAVAVNSGTGIVDALVPMGTDVTSLTPTFELPPGATVDPGASVPYDFSEPVTFQVRAEDGSVREYSIHVTVRDRTALLVIDIQNAIFPVYDEDRFLENVQDLIRRARNQDIQIVFLQFNDDGAFAPGTTGWQLHAPAYPEGNDVVIQKWYQDSFERTNLESLMQSGLVGRLVVTGLQSQYCVETTVLAALERSYRVVLVEDGHSTNSQDAASVITRVNQTATSHGAILVPSAGVVFETGDLR
jgi:nicotinamidase-related amidase